MNEDLRERIKEEIETNARNFKYGNISGVEFCSKLDALIDELVDSAIEEFKQSLTEY